jgi:hypothetical protein
MGGHLQSHKVLQQTGYLGAATQTWGRNQAEMFGNREKSCSLLLIQDGCLHVGSVVQVRTRQMLKTTKKEQAKTNLKGIRSVLHGELLSPPVRSITPEFSGSLVCMAALHAAWSIADGHRCRVC